MNINIQDCVLKEIIVEPLLQSNFEESVKCGLRYAIEYDVNVTVLRQGRAFRIVPQGIVREILEQHKNEGGD